MGAYATQDAIRRAAFAVGRGDEIRFDDYVERASRMIDLLCGVPADWFAPAPEQASALIFVGEGTAYLPTDPFVAGSVADAVYCDGEVAPDWRERRDSNGQCWLIARAGDVWSFDADVEVVARWGFADTPADIVSATVEITVTLWNQRDAKLARVIADVNGGQVLREEQIPKRVWEICERWRQRQRLVFA